MTYSKSIYIFHRSLRLSDNLGLIEALKNSDYVIPIFIFTPEQITKKNKFRTINAITFMMEALKDLNKQLKSHGSKLFIFYGKQHEVINKIIKDDEDIEAVYVNTDYTNYAIKREKQIEKICNKYDVELISIEDYLLQGINKILTSSNSFYSVFTPFYRNIIKLNVDKPISNNRKNYIKSNYKIKNQKLLSQIRTIINKDLKNTDDELLLSLPDFKATRKEGLKRINNIKNHKKYPVNRNILNQETTRLSPYIKFGLVSIREVYHKIKKLFGKNHDLIKQLYWREFYYNLTYNRPQVLDGKSFKSKYDKIKWNNNKTNFNKWKNGMTGYPVVDAGMRELNETGYMHNRTRLITSNFLIKLLGIDWREGEKYYSSKLVDYDPCVNNGNWQWGSGSGADSQPYFRIMNPWTQSKKFDLDCEYIKKWVPELEDVDNNDIHNWENAYNTYKDYNIKYPKPCIDYKTARNDIKKVYKVIF
jgi:deoxyribodipyrimidine photo-lyase